MLSIGRPVADAGASARARQVAAPQKAFPVVKAAGRNGAARSVEMKAVTATDEFSSLMTIADEQATIKFDELSADEARDIYHDMKLGREFEEMCAQMYYRGKMFGFVHLYSGQEAVSTGVIRLLGKKDYVCSTYRDHVHALSKNCSARSVMSELFGK